MFCDCIETLLKLINIRECLSNSSIAKFYLFVLETQESKLYLKEQLRILYKIYFYLSKVNHLWTVKDKFSIFMKRVIRYKVNKDINEKYICEDIQNKIFIIIFSVLSSERLKMIFKNKENSKMKQIKEHLDIILDDIYEESPAISFNKYEFSNNFWIKCKESKGDENVILNLTELVSVNYLVPFFEMLKKSCLKLISLNMIDLAEFLTSFYKFELEELKRLSLFTHYVEKNFDELKQESNVLMCLYLSLDKTSENYDENLFIVKSTLFDELSSLINKCRNFKTIEKIVAHQMLKLVIASKIDLEETFYLNFESNLEFIISGLIDSPTIDSEILIKSLNTKLDFGKILSDIVIRKAISAHRNNSLKSANQRISNQIFKYSKLLKNPKNFGISIKEQISTLLTELSSIKNQDSSNSQLFENENRFYIDLIFIGYYSFICDCHNDLKSFETDIKGLFTRNTNVESRSYIFNFLHQFDSNDEIKEIYYCLNQLLLQSKESNRSDSITIQMNEIEFYFKSKEFRQLGEKYLNCANEYSDLVNVKKNSKRIKPIEIKNEEELTILNFYVRAAEMFFNDNCIEKYSKVLEIINKLLKDNFNEESKFNL